MFAVAPASGLALDHRHPALQPLLAAGYPAARIEQVLAFYDEPHRRYHNRVHLHEMLDTAQQMGCALSPAQSLALLFHDAVYVPGAARGANEAMSAQLLRIYGEGMSASVIDVACRIIIDTADHVARSEPARLVLDLDLMRLAAGDADFDRYSREVFAEQRPLVLIDDDEAAWAFFQKRRVGFFERLLERPEIFCLPEFRSRFEATTRGNLRRAIDRALQAG